MLKCSISAMHVIYHWLSTNDKTALRAWSTVQLSPNHTDWSISRWPP